MKKHPNIVTKNAFFLIGATLALVACQGKSSNPTQNYTVNKDNTVPYTGEVSPTQEYVGDSLFSYNVENRNFKEDEVSTMKITVTPNSTKVTSFTVDAVKIPVGSQLQVSTKDPSVYELTWKPPTKTVTDQNIQPVEIELLIHPTAVADARLGALAKVIKDTIYVTVTHSRPEIISVKSQQVKEGSEYSIVDGKNMNFEVNYKDLSTYQGQAPQVNFVDCQQQNNSENPRENASSFIIPTSIPQKVGANDWKQSFRLETKNINNIITKDDTARLCTTVKVVNSNHTVSAQEMLYFRILYSPIKPEVKNVKSNGKAQSGYNYTLTFDVAAKKAVGTLDVTLTDVSTWPGSATATCEDAKLRNGEADSYLKHCELNWFISDDLSTLQSAYKFEVSAQHKVQRGDKELVSNTDLTKTIKVLKVQVKPAPEKKTAQSAGGKK